MPEGGFPNWCWPAPFLAEPRWEARSSDREFVESPILPEFVQTHLSQVTAKSGEVEPQMQEIRKGSAMSRYIRGSGSGLRCARVGWWLEGVGAGVCG